MPPSQFWFNWPSCYRGEDFQKSTNQKQELPVTAMFVNGSKQNEQSLQRTSDRCFLPSFGPFGQAVSEEKFFRNRPIRNKNYLWCVMTMLVNGSEPNDQSLQRTFHRCFLPRFGSFGKVVSEKKLSQKSTNQKHELYVAAMFVNESGGNEKSL